MRFRTVGLVAAGTVIVGAFLPWATVESIFGTSTRYGIESDGVLTLVGGAVVGALFLTARRGAYVAAAVVAGLIAVLGIYDWVDVQFVDGDAGAEGGVSTTAGAGLYVTIVGAATAVVAAVLARAETARSVERPEVAP